MLNLDKETVFRISFKYEDFNLLIIRSWFKIVGIDRFCLFVCLFVQAASFGGTNIDPTAWEDKKNQGESRFPAQVRVVTRKICEPLEEDSFRPILHHYDGPKFRLELNIPEV